MTITANTYAERVLIVLNADGSLKGAHQHTLTKFSGADIPDRQGDAEPISAETLATILPTQTALLAQVQSLTDQLAAANAAKDAAVAAKDAAEAALAAQNAAA